MTRQYSGYSRSSLLPGNKPGRRVKHKVYAEKYAQNAKYKTEAWKRLSKLVRRQDPYCFLCLTTNKLTLAESVDHIDGDSENDARENLLSLCHCCHAWKTGVCEKNGRVTLQVATEMPPLPKQEALDLLSQVSYNRLCNPTPLLASIIALHYQAFNTDYEW